MITNDVVSFEQTGLVCKQGRPWSDCSEDLRQMANCVGSEQIGNECVLTHQKEQFFLPYSSI